MFLNFQSPKKESDHESLQEEILLSEINDDRSVYISFSCDCETHRILFQWNTFHLFFSVDAVSHEEPDDEFWWRPASLLMFMILSFIYIYLHFCLFFYIHTITWSCVPEIVYLLKLWINVICQGLFLTQVLFCGETYKNDLEKSDTQTCFQHATSDLGSLSETWLQFICHKIQELLKVWAHRYQMMTFG